MKRVGYALRNVAGILLRGAYPDTATDANDVLVPIEVDISRRDVSNDWNLHGINQPYGFQTRPSLRSAQLIIPRVLLYLFICSSHSLT